MNYGVSFFVAPSQSKVSERVSLPILPARPATAAQKRSSQVGWWLVTLAGIWLCCMGVSTEWHYMMSHAIPIERMGGIDKDLAGEAANRIVFYGPNGYFDQIRINGHPKGQLSDPKSLPTTGNMIGDFYHIGKNTWFWVKLPGMAKPAWVDP